MRAALPAGCGAAPIAVLLLAFVCLPGGGQGWAQLTSVGDGRPGPVKAEHLTVELVTLGPQIAAGGKLQVGLSFTIEEKWHVFWVNPGDSGEPPRVRWKLPRGISAGPLQFPTPQRLGVGKRVDFGYQDQATFPITLEAMPHIKGGKVHLDARVSWLVCTDVCVPGKAHLGIDLNVVSGTVPEPPLVGALGAAIKGLPKPLPPAMSVSATAGAEEIVLTLKTGSREEDAEVYPFDREQIDNAADQQIESMPDGIRIRLKRSDESEKTPKEFHALVKLSDNEAYELTVPLKPGETPEADGPEAQGPPPGEVAGLTFFNALGLAFAGGILLNLMPCVFPVLFLKALALVNSNHEQPTPRRGNGLMYTLGILVSFWAVAAELLRLWTAGTPFEWGFQLQSPMFVALVAALLFLLALAVAAQIDIGLSLTGAGGPVRRKEGYAGSFLTGILMAVVATPCTVPLMGTAISYGLAHTAGAAVAVFTVLGLGLALPYLLLSWHTEWVRLLPHPGAWMQVLRQIASLPLFASVIGLGWIYGHLFAEDGVGRLVWLLVCFLMLAVAAWALRCWRARWAAAAAAVVLIAVGLACVLRQPKPEPQVWRPFTPASLEQARAKGKPVFINFTAAWCLTCRVNEALVLHSAAVQAKFAQGGVVLLKADWSQHNPVVSQQLADVGRSNVPVYVMYPPGATSTPHTLPELLTKGIVLQALEKDLKAAE